jgi:hypothetical protein
MQRTGLGIAALVFVAVSLVIAGPSHTEPAFSTKAAKEPKPLLGIVGKLGDSRLVRLDPRSLRPLRGPSLEILDSTGAWAFSPDRSLLALGTSCQAGISLGTLQIVDVRRMRPVGCYVTSGFGGLSALAWPTPNRVVAASHSPNPLSPLQVVVIDTSARRVIQRTTFAGVRLTSARSRNGLVVLTGRTHLGEPQQVVVADADGSVRAVDMVVPSASALVVDTSGRRGYLVSADTVAVVDLDTLAVTYHELRSSVSARRRTVSALAPAAQAKSSRHELRRALWLGGGLIAAFGSDFTYEDRGSSSVPVGLRLIDTRDWTVRMVDEQVSHALLAGNVLLAAGDAKIGLVAYDLRGVKRYERFRGRSVAPIESYRGKAWIHVGRPKLQVLDVRTGRVLGPGPFPSVLVER